MRSELHKKVLAVVKECYPREKIIEEKSFNIGGKTLYLDIFIPRLKIAFECDGRQHYEFNKFFHQDAYSFNNGKKNDRLKEEYCEDSGITLVRIKYNENINKDILTDKIINRLKDIK